jgi:hypothetical protein
MQSIGFLLSPVLLRDLNVPKRPGPLVLLRTCQFSWNSFVESAGHRPTALSCSHPSGSKPDAGRHAPGAGPVPTRRDQNNVSTAPGSSGVPPTGETGHIGKERGQVFIIHCGGKSGVRSSLFTVCLAIIVHHNWILRQAPFKARRFPRNKTKRRGGSGARTGVPFPASGAAASDASEANRVRSRLGGGIGWEFRGHHTYFENGYLTRGRDFVGNRGTPY